MNGGPTFMSDLSVDYNDKEDEGYRRNPITQEGIDE